MNLNTKIFILIVIVLSLYILGQMMMFVLKSKKIHRNQLESYNDYLSAKNNLEKSKKTLFTHVESIFGQEVTDHLKSGTIWENMPVYLLKIALGEPEKISKKNESSFWFYGPFKDEKQEEYFLQVVIENNAVKSWDKGNPDEIPFENKLLIN